MPMAATISVFEQADEKRPAVGGSVIQGTE